MMAESYLKMRAVNVPLPSKAPSIEYVGRPTSPCRLSDILSILVVIITLRMDFNKSFQNSKVFFVKSTVLLRFGHKLGHFRINGSLLNIVEIHTSRKKEAPQKQVYPIFEIYARVV
jgi:hypothetical protein